MKDHCGIIARSLLKFKNEAFTAQERNIHEALYKNTDDFSYFGTEDGLKTNKLQLGYKITNSGKSTSFILE